jgi:hypothetical protein
VPTGVTGDSRLATKLVRKNVVCADTGVSASTRRLIRSASARSDASGGCRVAAVDFGSSTKNRATTKVAREPQNQQDQQDESE